MSNPGDKYWKLERDSMNVVLLRVLNESKCQNRKFSTSAHHLFEGRRLWYMLENGYTRFVACGLQYAKPENAVFILCYAWLSVCHPSFPDSPEDMPDYPLFISIGDWLDSIKMSQYKNNFLAAGYTTLDSISTMSIEWVKPNYTEWSHSIKEN